MSWLAAGLGWALFAMALWRLGRRRGLLADAEHELRAALTAIALSAERMRRSGATAAFNSLVTLQLDRVDAALADLGRARGRRGPPAVGAAGTPDAGRLAQVLANLIANAAEHGAGPIEVRWRAGGRRAARDPQRQPAAGARRPRRPARGRAGPRAWDREARRARAGGEPRGGERRRGDRGRAGAAAVLARGMRTPRRRGLVLLALALACGGLAASQVRERERSVAAKVGPLVPVVVAAQEIEADRPLRVRRPRARAGAGALRAAGRAGGRRSACRAPAAPCRSRPGRT